LLPDAHTVGTFAYLKHVAAARSNPCFLCRAVIWFVYMLIYGVLPQNLSQGVFHLFEEVMAGSPTFWLLIIMAPLACVLPGYLWRQIRS
jgi:hypothetical protein